MKLDDKDISFFQTSEFGLVATLLCSDFYVDHVDDSNSSRVIFFFKQSDKLADTLKNYWEGKLRIEPKTYWNTLRELKGRIRNEWGQM